MRCYMSRYWRWLNIKYCLWFSAVWTTSRYPQLLDHRRSRICRDPGYGRGENHPRRFRRSIVLSCHDPTLYLWIGCLRSTTSSLREDQNWCNRRDLRVCWDCRCTLCLRHRIRPRPSCLRRLAFRRCSIVCHNLTFCYFSIYLHSSLHLGSRIFQCHFSYHYFCILRIYFLFSSLRRRITFLLCYRIYMCDQLNLHIELRLLSSYACICL